MKYKYLIIGNSSTFDTSLNYLLNLKKDNHQIEILFCVGNKNQIINKESFISDFLIKNNIPSFDLADFFINKKLKIIWTSIFSNNKFNYYKSKKNLFFLKFIPVSFFNFIEKLIGDFFLSQSKLSTFLSDTDYLLIDFRHKYESFGKKNIDQIIKKIDLKNILLLPHACHYTRPFDEFKGIESKDGISIPMDKVIFWIPMYYNELENYKKYQYEILGYPEIDNCLKNPSDYKSKNNILILVRNFRIDDLSTKDDSFLYQKNENSDLFNFYLEIKNKYFPKKKFIFKLHPKISEDLFLDFIDNIWPDNNYDVVYDSIFGYLDRIYMSISSYSTLNIVTISKKIPTIIVNCRFHQYVNKWSKLDQIYKKFNFFSEDLKDCENKIKYILHNDISKELSNDSNLVKKIWQK